MFFRIQNFMKATLWVAFLILFINCKNNPVCSINEKNAGKKIYNLDEATCFIALKLKKKTSDLKLIEKALIAEEKYMIKIGLVYENQNVNTEKQSDTVLNIDELINYAQIQEKVELTRNELLMIYETEIEYFKFIGIVEEKSKNE